MEYLHFPQHVRREQVSRPEGLAVAAAVVDFVAESAMAMVRLLPAAEMGLVGLRLLLWSP